MRILICEDDPMFAMLVKRSLMNICIDIVTTDTLKGALSLLSEIPPPDVIFLDLVLNDSGADNTISRIHEIRESNEESVILVLTGAPSIDREGIIAAGADDVFEKTEMMPIGRLKKSFMDNLSDAFRSLVKTPTRWKKNVRIVELMAERLAKRTQPPAS